MQIIRTERLLFRPVRMSDVVNIHRLTRDEEIIKYTQVPRNYSIKKAREQRKKENLKVKQGKALYFAIILKDNKENFARLKNSPQQIIGMISLNNINKEHKRAAIGYFLGKEYRNKGYMKEACKAILYLCFTKLKLNRIEFLCSVENKASQKVIESLNAVFEGIQRQKTYKEGKFHDKRVYAILYEEWLKENE